jgi:adenosylmethionine-8-amino-7-oxononanoate aminotransferase
MGRRGADVLCVELRPACAGEGKRPLDWQERERQQVWHPYAPMVDPPPVYPVHSADGVRLTLEDGRELIDGMASWWCAIHGYNHPRLNAAVTDQLSRMAHVMFGGLTHRPAAELAERLVALTPDRLEKVFFCDSGSVSVEVALKMAIQYWQARDCPQRHRILTVRNGYHGDTTGAMSVCDPVNGMHHLFSAVLPERLFAPAPDCPTDDAFTEACVDGVRQQLEAHRGEVAALIIEPLVQGAGGMRFHCPRYLQRLRELCDEHGVLLIFDEIATGFGRTGHLFASYGAGVTPDLICLGKALTGGYMTLAATVTTADVSDILSRREPGAFMHGPTFMANPLACAAANASIEQLHATDWQANVRRIEQGLAQGLAPARELGNVADVRCFGAIGVIEMTEPADMAWMQPALVNRGVWVRPFGTLVYVMPPFIMSDPDVATLTAAMVETVAEAANGHG